MITSIEVSSEVVDLCFHPKTDAIALAHIDGHIDIFSYITGSDCISITNYLHHKKACRTVSFNSGGERLISSSSDKSILIVDVDTTSKLHHFKNAHDCPIYSLLIIDDNIISSGDDDGFLKIWDLRKNGAIMSIKENNDCLTDMLIDDAKRELLVTSGEGTLTSFDIRKHKMRIQSELFDSGLNSISRVMENSKVICGSEDGVLNIFNDGEWGNISDRFPGHASSIESIVQLSDHVICTADEDGVRLVHLFPNRFIGIIGTHEGLSVENLSLSRCHKWIASCSHDQRVRFWDVSQAADKKIDSKSRANKFDNKRVINGGENVAGCSSNFFDDLLDYPPCDKKQKLNKSLPGKKSEDIKSVDDDDNDDDDVDNDKDKLSSTVDNVPVKNSRTEHDDDDNDNDSSDIADDLSAEESDESCGADKESEDDKISIRKIRFTKNYQKKIILKHKPDASRGSDESDDE